ncbi:MAG: hypothetical protein KGJ13_06240, partial [Patescibacteria group bacterium]|nr:hypothetical protein [Patescibacteria group bacterium]
MHNGGKFDFMFLLEFVTVATNVQMINGRIVSMALGEAQLIDSFAGVPQALGSIKKDEIEYWKMDKEYRIKYREEIISYLKGDCIYLHELMTAYRKSAGKKKTIASNALAHAKSLGINPGTTNHRFDANYRPFYFGGRTQCFRPGTHEHISVFDIKSSYPRAMMEDHATGTELHWHDDFHDMSREEIQRSFIILKCFSNGAFPIRAQGSEGLNFPKEYNEYYVTVWEYIAAKDLGLIDD